jgi:CBS domain containing-hemolysin-like protein
VNRALNLSLDDKLADTFSGYLMSSSEKVLTIGDSIMLPGAKADVQEVEVRHAKTIRVIIDGSNQDVETKDTKTNRKA